MKTYDDVCAEVASAITRYWMIPEVRITYYGIIGEDEPMITYMLRSGTMELTDCTLYTVEALNSAKVMCLLYPKLGEPLKF